MKKLYIHPQSEVVKIRAERICEDSNLIKLGDPVPENEDDGLKLLGTDDEINVDDLW